MRRGGRSPRSPAGGKRRSGSDRNLSESTFPEQGPTAGSDPLVTLLSPHAFGPPTVAMGSIFVLDAHVAYPVAAIPAPVVGVPVSPAFRLPGCHHDTSRPLSATFFNTCRGNKQSAYHRRIIPFAKQYQLVTLFIGAGEGKTVCEEEVPD